MNQTPQSRWARKQQRAGKCRICARERNRYKWLCDEHGQMFNEYMKRYRKGRKLNAKKEEQPHEATDQRVDSPSN